MEQKSLMNELMQGKDLAKQLVNHLQPCSSNEIRLFLIQKILSSYENSLSILNWGAFVDDSKTLFDSISSPNIGYRNDRKRKNKEIDNNRKTQPRWTEQVKDCSGTGLEGPLDDGYSWRKYGQKAILGANFPRCYYRCTYRHGSGCLAKKQVQRSDEDQTIFEITYEGRHTCTQDSQSLTQSNPVKKEVQDQPRKLQNIPKKLDEMRFDFDTDVKVKMEGSETGKDDFSPSICFSNWSESAEENFLTDLLIENNFLVSSSPPPTSESNYFPAFQTLPQNVHTPESNLPDIISIASPFQDFDFDSNFPYQTPDLFYPSSQTDAYCHEHLETPNHAGTIKLN